MEMAARQLVHHLPVFGVEPRVITSRVPAGPDEPGVTRLAAIDVAHTPVMWGLLPALMALPRDCILHVHVAQAFVPDLAAFVARRRGQRVLAHYHLDVDRSGRLGMLLRPYQRTLLKHTLTRADAVVVPTPDYADIVCDRYGVDRARLQVVPGATSIPVASAPWSAPTTPVRLVSVGRLSDQKNHALLIEAISHLQEGDPDIAWELDILGEGEERPRLERQIAQLGLEDVVRLRGGGFDAGQLRQWYDQADLFVLATRKESFGLVYVEAMARGLPIVSTRAAGVRNVVVPEVNGVLADHDPAALAEAIRTVATEANLYEKFSSQNLTTANTYSWPAVAQRFSELYRDLSTG